MLIEDIDDQAYPAPTEQSMGASRDIGISSVIAAPLKVRGMKLGVLSLALSGLTVREDSKHYVADDRDLVAAIASRVAIAIDNSMLFEEERATALAFQDSLLPSNPPMLDGLEVAYRYVPAKPLETHGQGIQTQVGGDWYDIIQLSAGRVGIVIGDVAGPRCPGRRRDGPVAVGVAGVRAGRQGASGHHAQAGRVVPVDDRRGRQPRATRRSSAART